jgi:hypothetical protein
MTVYGTGNFTAANFTDAVVTYADFELQSDNTTAYKTIVPGPNGTGTLINSNDDNSVTQCDILKKLCLRSQGPDIPDTFNTASGSERKQL